MNNSNEKTMRDSLLHIYVGFGAGWNVEIYCRWSDVFAARRGVSGMMKHLREQGVECKAIRGNVEIWSGTFETVVRTDVQHDGQKVVDALLTPRL